MRINDHHTGPSPPPPPLTIGVLSDTHGQLAPEVVDRIGGMDLVLHAGDIDGPEILQALGKPDKVKAVRGNMDLGKWSQTLPHEEFVAAGDILIYMIHDLHRVSIDPASADVRIVVSGHTHRPAAVQRNGVLYLNPGSPSFPRGGHKPSIAQIEIAADRFTYRHIHF
jgi:putative phosphoesterase